MSDMVTTVPAERDIETVTQEIRVIKRQAEGIILQSAIEIGRRLQEAKALVPFGEWGKYLQERVEFSQSTANNMMKLAEEYGDQQISLFGIPSNSETLANLNYTKALKLLAIPAEERDAFIEEHDVEGMSTRELEKVIRERDEAKAALDSVAEKVTAAEATASKATAEAEALREQLTAIEEKVAKAKEAEKKAKEKLKALKENPEIPAEVLQRIRGEAETAAGEKAEAEKQAALAEAKAAEESARAAAQKAEQEAAEIADKLAAMEKQVRAASPEVTVFKTLFARVQDEYKGLLKALDDVCAVDAETGERLKAAVTAMLKKWEEQL